MRAPTILLVDSGDELTRQVSRAATSLRPRPKLASCPDVASVQEVLAKSTAVDVIIAGPGLVTAPGLLELRQLRQRLPEASLILTFPRRGTANLRDTIRTGAVDILRLPVDDKAIADAIVQALEVRWGPEEGRPAGPGPGRVGEVVAVVSATGGCGKTFLAVNMAFHLQSAGSPSPSPRRACLIDLDLQFGELSTALRLKPALTIADLVAVDEEEDLSTRLEEHMVVHSTGLAVLAGPELPVEADAIDAADVARVIDAARHRFDYVVVDTPPSLSEAMLVSLEYADRVFAVATLDLPSMRNLGLLLSTMRQLKVPEDRVRLVLNKVEPDVGMDMARLTRYFPQGFEFVVPYGREANRSLNMGLPVLAFSPNSHVGRALDAGLAAALPVGGEASAHDASARRGVLGRLRRRSA